MKKINEKQPPADYDIEQFIGLQLRWGVIIASLVVLTGGLLYLGRLGGLSMPDYKDFIGERAGFTTAGQIWNGVLNIEPKGIIELGVVFLIATPILRIFFSLIGFILEKDKMYTAITFLVLCVMLFSVFGGLKV